MVAYKITIRIRTNKAGRRVAHYWGRARRWLPIGLAQAELMVASGEAYSE